MRERAPTYYDWAFHHPWTSNATYGYLLRDYPRKGDPIEKDFDPFENCKPFDCEAFCPDTTKDCSCTQKSNKQSSPRILPRLIDIRQGYSSESVPVREKIKISCIPPGAKYCYSPEQIPAYPYPPPAGKRLFMWSTLRNSTVDAVNYPSPGYDEWDQYRIKKGRDICPCFKYRPPRRVLVAYKQHCEKPEVENYRYTKVKPIRKPSPNPSEPCFIERNDPEKLLMWNVLPGGPIVAVDHYPYKKRECKPLSHYCCEAAS